MSDIQWTHLSQVHVYNWLSDELRNEAEALNARIADVLERRREINQSLAAIEAADVGKVEFTTLVFCSDHVETVCLILQDELALRRNLADYYTNREPDRRQEEENASKAHLAAKEKITQALVELGYINVPNPSERVIGRIQPGWVAEHPKVHAALQRVRDIHDTASFQQMAQQNLDAAQRVTRSRLFVGLGEQLTHQGRGWHDVRGLCSRPPGHAMNQAGRLERLHLARHCLAKCWRGPVLILVQTDLQSALVILPDQIMESGWSWVGYIFAGGLMWSAKKPSLTFWKPDSGEVVFHATCFNPQNSVRRAYRCSKCGAITVQPNVKG